MGILIADFTGLVTAPGVFARGKGSCSELYNVSMGQPGVISTRLGFGKSVGKLGGPIYTLRTDNGLGDSVLAHFGSTTEPTYLRFGDFSGTPGTLFRIDDDSGAEDLTKWTDVSNRIKMATALNRYITTDVGVLRIEEFNQSKAVRFAGMPRGMPADLANNDPAVYSVLNVSGTAALNILASGYARNYRFTWHRYDENDVLLSGPPTSRTLIHNATGTSGFTAAASYVKLRVQVPKEWGCNAIVFNTTSATTGDYFVRVWATRTYNLSGGTPGGDEMFLVKEVEIGGTAVTAGYIVVDDTTPDAFLVTAPPLNTNSQNVPQGEESLRPGVDNADEPAPFLAWDVAYHQDVMWYSCAFSRSRVRVSLQTYIPNATTVTITGGLGNQVFTAENAIPVSGADAFYVPVLTTLNLSIDRQASNLANVINRRFTETGVWCYHESSPFTEPGVLIFECPDTAYGTPLVVFSDTTIIRKEQIDVGANNALRYSKPGRPDACPEYKLFFVGSKQNVIRRLFPYRERLLVFTDEGIFQVTGRTQEDFSVSPFDLSHRILGNESVALADDRVYAHCYSGIVEIDDGGVQVISQPIENILTDKLVDPDYGATPFINKSFGVGYRLKHEYRFFYPTVATATGYACDAWLTFDTRTRAWSQGYFNLASLPASSYNQGRACGVVLESDRLALGPWDFGGGGSANDAFLCTEHDEYIDLSSQDATVYSYVSLIARFQFFNPNEDGMVHWQQTILKLNSYSEGANPIVTWYNGENITSASYDPSTVYTPDLRLETPTAVRRSTRLSVKITNDTAYKMSLAALQLKFASPTSYGSNNV